VAKSVRGVLEGTCVASFAWLAGDTVGGIDVYPETEIADASAIVFGTPASACSPPLAGCGAAELCITALRAPLDRAGSLAVTHTIPWIDQSKVATGVYQPTTLERRMIIDLARSKLFPSNFSVAPDDTWSCLYRDDNDCMLGLERYSGGVKAVAFNDGFAAKADPGSLVYWAASLADGNAIRQEIFKDVADQSLAVRSQTDTAWLVSYSRDNGSVENANLIITGDSPKEIPVKLLSPYRTGTRSHPWAPAEKRDPLLATALGMITRQSATEIGPWTLDDLGSVSDGRRVLITSGKTAYLISTVPGKDNCLRSAQFATLTSKIQIPGVNAARIATFASDPIAALHETLSLSAAEWRADFPSNPIAMIFGNDCAAMQ